MTCNIKNVELTNAENITHIFSTSQIAFKEGWINRTKHIWKTVKTDREARQSVQNQYTQNIKSQQIPTTHTRLHTAGKHVQSLGHNGSYDQ